MSKTQKNLSEEKRCLKCNQVKKQVEFNKDRSKKNGVRSHCKSCTGHLDRLHAWKRRGIKIDFYGFLALLANQNSVCAICGKEDVSGRGLSVDHDHINNRIRGLLCNSCNQGLGYFKDNVSFLEKAIDYLQKHPAKQLEQLLQNESIQTPVS